MRLEVSQARELLKYGNGPLTESGVRAAYRLRVKEVHPDKGGTQIEFELVQKAMEFLMGVAVPSKTIQHADDWSEKRFEFEVRAKIRAEGGMTFKIHGHGMQERGWPDLQVYSKIWTGHLELKVGHHNCEPDQVRKIKELRFHGTDVWVGRYCGTRVTLEWVDKVPVWSGNWDEFGLQLLRDVSRRHC